MKAIAKIVATGFGTGYAPLAPGTVGSLMGVALYYLLYIIDDKFIDISNFNIILLICIVIGFFIGVWSTNILENEWGKDPSRVVWDEILGIWVSLIFLPFSLISLILAFVLFRIFDIWKPLGIRKVENLKGGTGVMLDDILAGILTNVVIRIILFVV